MEIHVSEVLRVLGQKEMELVVLREELERIYKELSERQSRADGGSAKDNAKSPCRDEAIGVALHRKDKRKNPGDGKGGKG